MLAFREIRDRGYERIGFVTGQASERGALHKAGFMMAQEWVDPALRLPPLTLDEADPSDGRRRLASGFGTWSLKPFSPMWRKRARCS